MSQLDASSEGLTEAEEMAERADCVRLAAVLLREAGLGESRYDPHDVYTMARFLYRGE